MPATFQTSFIPKKSLAETAKVKTSGINILGLGGVVIFVLALILSAGAFLYHTYLKGSISKKEARLAEEKGAYEPATIEELRRLDGRIESSREILKNHIALSGLFDLLQKETLESVRFTSFNYSHAPDGMIKLIMEGEAQSFGSIALQSDEFGKSRYIKEPIFSGLNLDKSGNVLFEFTALVEPSLISFERMVLESEGALPQEPVDSVPDELPEETPVSATGTGSTTRQ